MVGAATAKLRVQSMCGHVGQPTNYSLMNEVYETERIVSVYRVNIGRLSSTDSFVSDAGDLKLKMAPFSKSVVVGAVSTLL